MNRCETCPINSSCNACLELIDGGGFRKKLNPPLNVRLYNSRDNSDYFGRLAGISRVGMLIETDAPADNYYVDLDGKFKAFLSPIFHKGTEGIIAFDIVKVIRPLGTDVRLSKDEYDYLSMNKKELIDHLTENLQKDVKEKIREELQNELIKSELLNRLIAGSTYKYENGRIKQLSGQNDPLIKEKYMLDLMEMSLKLNEPKRDTIIDTENERYIDIHSIPLGNKTGGFLTFDITDIVRKEKELLQEQWDNYKEVISSITKGKLLLINALEMDELLQKYKKISELEISDAKQLKNIRDEIKKILYNENIPEKRYQKITLAVQEAATNSLKYASSGKVEIWFSENEIVFVIEDRGTGIPLKDIPKATLINGFSTSSTLGQGFNLMTNLVDKIYLKSDKTGTKVGLLIKKT